MYNYWPVITARLLLQHARRMERDAWTRLMRLPGLSLFNFLFLVAMLFTWQGRPSQADIFFYEDRKQTAVTQNSGIIQARRTMAWKACKHALSLVSIVQHNILSSIVLPLFLNLSLFKVFTISYVQMYIDVFQCIFYGDVFQSVDSLILLCMQSALESLK